LTRDAVGRVRPLGFPYSLFFISYGSRAVPRTPGLQFIDKFEKDNEVKKTRSKLISFFYLTQRVFS